MANLPLISIVTPCYNQGRFLGEAIRSVLGQTYSRIEYIVIDDGSTDETAEVIREHADRLAFWDSRPNRGQTATINQGFARASGDILAWLNSDDLYLPGAISKVADAFMRDPETSVIHGDMLQIDERGRTVARASGGPFDLKRLLCGRGCRMFQPGSFFRRRVIESVGPLVETFHYAMDYDLWLKAGRKFKFAYIPEILAKVRYHDLGKMSLLKIGFQRDGRNALEKFFSLPDLEPEFRALEVDAFRENVRQFIWWSVERRTASFFQEYFGSIWEGHLLQGDEIRFLAEFLSEARLKNDARRAAALVWKLHERLSDLKGGPLPAASDSWLAENSGGMLLYLANHFMNEGRGREALTFLRTAVRWRPSLLVSTPAAKILAKALLGRSLAGRFRRLRRRE